jgi:citrate synthase
VKGENNMRATKTQMEKILKFREQKIKDLQRNISFSEAIALWLAESKERQKVSQKSITSS